MQLQWVDVKGMGVVSGTPEGIIRFLWHDGEHFICDWEPFWRKTEQWILDPVSDLAAAKVVVESWETPEGWEDDE